MMANKKTPSDDLKLKISIRVLNEMYIHKNKLKQKRN